MKMFLRGVALGFLTGLILKVAIDVIGSGTIGIGQKAAVAFVTAIAVIVVTVLMGEQDRRTDGN